MFLTLGVFVLLWTNVMARVTMAGIPVFGSGRSLVYLLTQAEVIVHYLRLAIVPYPLCLDYQWPLASGLAAVWWQTVLVGLLVLITAVGVVRRRPGAFLGVWFFGLLAPTSSFMPFVDAAFEHRMYLPLAAVVAAVVLGGGAGLRAVVQRGGNPRIAWMVGGVAVFAAWLTLTGLTLARNRDYCDPVELWRGVVRSRPGNLRARNAVAVWLMKAGRLDEATGVCRAVLALTEGVEGFSAPPGPWERVPVAMVSPRHNRYRALANLAAIERQQGRPDLAREYYLQALRLFPYWSYCRDRLMELLQEEQGMTPTEAEQTIEDLLWHGETND
jgi:hypothetical protein